MLNQHVVDDAEARVEHQRPHVARHHVGQEVREQDQHGEHLGARQVAVERQRRDQPDEEFERRSTNVTQTAVLRSDTQKIGSLIIRV